MKSQRKKIFVGLSGGVDSSVTAALLVREGHDVTGVFIKSWHPDWYPCTWKEDRRDAMRICARLGIPFLTLDLEREYKEKVIDYLIHEYRSGRTPNPDVMCNKHIKFGLFLEYALSMGAEYVATGHYARIERHSNVHVLARGIDMDKDQSYFLWTLGQHELSHTLFPLGTYTKTETRTLAKKLSLPTYAKPDSQGLCFVGNISMSEFLSHYIDIMPGCVLDMDGNTIGRHDGAVLYTIGQRHGFTITDKGTDSAKMYVTSRDIEKNTITVSAHPEQASVSRFEISHAVWSIIPDAEKTYNLQSRYRQTPFLGNISAHIVTPRKPQAHIAVGQSLVVYDGDICLGGGIISKVLV